jgi:hypothetical protein
MRISTSLLRSCYNRVKEEGNQKRDDSYCGDKSKGWRGKDH